MGLINYIVGDQFRNEKAGRVIVFPGDRRGRGYLVRSEAEESRIRAFLKMFYFAHLSILMLGNFLAMGCSTVLNHELGIRALHFYKAMGIALGIYCIIVGLPYWLLWRSYKKEFPVFTSGLDEVVISGISPGQKNRIYVGAGVIVLAILMGVALFMLVRAK